MALIDTDVGSHRSGHLYRDFGVVHRPHDRLKTRSEGRYNDKADKAEIEYRGYTSARGSVMLDVVVNGARRYRLGPFVNKPQRLVLLQRLRSLGASATRWR